MDSVNRPIPAIDAIADGKAKVKVRYTNYKGDTKVREIVPLSVSFKSTMHHPEPQWILECWDCDKDAYRSYTLKDCDFVNTKIPLFTVKEDEYGNARAVPVDE